MLNEDIREKYTELLKQHQKAIKEYLPVFSPRQRKFFDIVIDIILNPDLTGNQIADRQGCGERTVDRASKVIRSMRLPFRYSEWLDCRRVEYKTQGKMTARTVKSLRERARKKSAK